LQAIAASLTFDQSMLLASWSALALFHADRRAAIWYTHMQAHRHKESTRSWIQGKHSIMDTRKALDHGYKESTRSWIQGKHSIMDTRKALDHGYKESTRSWIQGKHSIMDTRKALDHGYKESTRSRIQQWVLQQRERTTCVLPTTTCVRPKTAIRQSKFAVIGTLSGISVCM